MEHYLFWIHWRILKNFFYLAKCNSPQSKVWAEDSEPLFGTDIPNEEEGRRKILERRKIKEKKSSKIKGFPSKTLEVFECPIWIELMDPDYAVTTSWWGKTWWFDCIISCLKESSQCPHWRKTIKKNHFTKNKTLVELYEIILNDLKSEIQNECLKWESHQKEWSVFWNDCQHFVWIKWVLEKHRDHSWEEIEEKRQNEIHRFTKNKLQSGKFIQWKNEPEEVNKLGKIYLSK